MSNFVHLLIAGLVFFAGYRLIVFLGLKDIVDFVVAVAGIISAIVALVSWF